MRTQKVGEAGMRVLNVAMTVAALVVAGLVIRKELISEPSSTRIPQEHQMFVLQNEWESLFTAGQRIGPPGAPIVLAIFSDYECPACKALSDRLQQIQKDTTLAFAVLYRHWPLSRHQFAEKAAIASECAAEQNRFAPMHHMLFEKQRQLGVIGWDELAVSAGVMEPVRFARCMEETSVLNKVRAEKLVAECLDSRGTPTVVVHGGMRFVGVPSARTLDSLIRSVLAGGLVAFKQQ
jgi:predicted DsbA family dithiol-disulfide isomerase